MGEFDLDTHQLYQQLLSGEAHLGTGGGQNGAAASSAFFQPPPPQAPTLPGDQWVIDPAGYVAAEGFSALPQPLQIPGGGVWSGNDDGFVQVPGGQDWLSSGHRMPQGKAWAGTGAEESMMLRGNALLGSDDLVHGVGVPGVSGSLQEMLMGGVDLSKFMSDEAAVNSLWASAMVNSLAANQAAAHPSIYAQPPNQPASDSSGPSTQFGAAASPGMMPQMPAYPTVVDYQQAPPPTSVDIPLAVPVPDEEEAELAQLVHAAARCGDDEASTAWSEEENQVLREGLSRFACQDKVTKCFSIASVLANKTVLDVAYRIRWLSDLEKKRAAKQAQLDQEKSAQGKVTKVLDSKSAKDLIRDNDRLMDKIEEILKTGKVANIDRSEKSYEPTTPSVTTCCHPSTKAFYFFRKQTPACTV